MLSTMHGNATATLTLSPAPLGSTPVEDTISATLRADPAVAQRMVEDALAARPEDPSLRHLRAEALARQGRFTEALPAFRHAARLAGVLIPDLPTASGSATCPACGEAEAELCWVGAAQVGEVCRWVRCLECRTARRLDPPHAAAAAQARRRYLQQTPMTTARLHEAILHADAIIERIREEGYGTHWITRPAARRRAQMLVLGAGWGALPAAAAWRGFEVEAVEADPVAAAWARETLGVVTWAELDHSPPTTADVIGVEDGVSDHPAPGELRRRLNQRLVPGGLLALCVPCLDHPLHRAMDYDDPRWTRPDARAWFERGSLSLCLLRAGLQPTRALHHPHRPGEVIILAGRS